jgi:hypothetical protein
MPTNQQSNREQIAALRKRAERIGYTLTTVRKGQYEVRHRNGSGTGGGIETVDRCLTILEREMTRKAARRD